MRRFGECVRKCDRSCAGVVVPPRRSCGRTLRVEEGYTAGGGSVSVSFVV